MRESFSGERQEKQARLRFGLVFGVLFLFWAATAVCVAAIVTVAAWDGRDDSATASAPTATVAATATPAPTSTPESRPRIVPLTAKPLAGDYDSGEPQQHLFFHLGCVEDVLAVITTDEHVFAEMVCPAFIDPLFVRPFLGDAVRITVAEGRIDIVTIAGERLTFPIGRVWIERR
jgi:hypothetical protein